MVEIHRNSIAFCRIRTLKLCLGYGWVSGRNTASDNLILIAFEGIIIESILTFSFSFVIVICTAAWGAVGPLSGGGGTGEGFWWMLDGWKSGAPARRC